MFSWMKKKSATPELSGDEWERAALYDLAASGLKEQKRQTRTNAMFKFGILIYLFFIAYGMYGKASVSESVPTNHIAKIKLSGIIADGSDFNADNTISLLNKAFRNEGSVGILLELNSPGGSPVQSRYIYDEIMRLKEAYPEKPVKAVITDTCASGCYYVAAAADEIIADSSSLVGSIGVIMSSFGFTGAMEKLGIERRLITAGDNKAMLDPFSNTNPKHVAHFDKLLSSVHKDFVDAVVEGRNGLVKRDDDIFNGLVWSGSQAVTLGLVDSLGSTHSVAREGYSVTDIKDYEVDRSFLTRLGRGLSAYMVNEISTKMMTSQMY